MKKIRWGIIGCGNVTELKSGPAFNKVPDSSLVAVMRRNEAKARDYAHRHGVPKWYSDADRIINDPEVNAIYIATPPRFHEAYTLAALKAGKPVYVEKPMALNAAEAMRMQSAAASSGIPVCVAHYRRRQPYFLKIKSLLEEGSVGTIRFANLQLLQPHRSSMIADTEENWRVDPAISGGGLFHDLAPHQLDLMLYFFGAWEHASGYSFNQGGYYKADDFTTGHIIFNNGVAFHGLWSFAVPAQEQKDICEIVGTKGTISFGIFNQQGIFLTTEQGRETFTFDALQHVQQPMIDQVVQHFLGKAPNPCTVADGVSVMRLIDAFTINGPTSGR